MLPSRPFGANFNPGPGNQSLFNQLEQKSTHSIRKAERLKHRNDIQALFGKGKTFFVHPVKAVYSLRPLAEPEDDASLPRIKMGVSASKRQFKKAVDRNRVKRLLREAYRLNKAELEKAAANRPFQLHVFFLYVDKSLPTFGSLEEKMKHCLKKLAKMLEEK